MSSTDLREWGNYFAGFVAGMAGPLVALPDGSLAPWFLGFQLFLLVVSVWILRFEAPRRARAERERAMKEVTAAAWTLAHRAQAIEAARSGRGADA